jgi:hypothetical protein
MRSHLLSVISESMVSYYPIVKTNQQIFFGDIIYVRRNEVIMYGLTLSLYSTNFIKKKHMFRPKIIYAPADACIFNCI